MFPFDLSSFAFSGVRAVSGARKISAKNTRSETELIYLMHVVINRYFFLLDVVVIMQKSYKASTFEDNYLSASEAG